MNTSEKLRYLIETKEKIKDSINFVGGGREHNYI